MACECKSKLQERFLGRVKEQLPDSKNHKVDLNGYAYVFNDNGGMDLVSTTTVEIEHTVTVKKTGLDRVKKEKQSLIHTFCPYCGVRYKEKKDAQEAETA